jgi:hypothetical protein
MEGRVEIVNNQSLELHSRVHDVEHNTDFEWESAQPFLRTIAVRGDLKRLPKYGITESLGVMLV